MKYISTFSGIEAASVAWEHLGWEPLAFSEIEPYPCAVLAHRFPDVPNLGDITKIDWSETIERVGRPDVIVGGSPCFVAGTLVLCEDGFKPIEDVRVGDRVVTHKGRLKKVLKTGGHIADETIVLRGQGTVGLECTPNHPFLSKSKEMVWDNERRCAYRIPEKDAHWVEAKDMLGRFWFNVCAADSVSAPQLGGHGRGERGKGYIEHLDLTPEFFYLVGRWLGDGWANAHKRKGRKESYMKRVYLCCSHDEADELEAKLNKTGLHFSRVHERTTERFTCSSTQLHDWLISNFGVHADGKNMPAWALGMDDHRRRSLLQGYLAADGTIVKSGYKATTINRKLSIGIKMLAGSLGMPTSVCCCKNDRIAKIEGRVVNERPQYVSSYYNSYRSAFFDGCGFFGKVRNIEPGHKNVQVYNLEVEDDNSYTADGIAVHNCQSFSLAGGRDSLAGASRLMFEYIRAVREVRPKFILWENVPGVLNTRDNAFGQLLCEIQDCGYSLAWRVLDSQFVRVPDRDVHGRIRGWYGPVAQRRRRVFLVGHLGEGSGASAAVLFEQDCLRGNLTSSREKRKDLARAAKDNAGTSSGFKWHQGANAGGVGFEEEQSPTITAEGKMPGCIQEFDTLPIDTMTALRGGDAQDMRQALGIGQPDDPSYTITQAHEHAVATLAFNTTNITSPANGNNPQLNQGGIAVVCAASSNTRAAIDDNVAGTLMANNQKNPPYIASEYIVRRLTPKECERLQGFPDGWTLLTDCDVDKVTELVCAALEIEDDKGIKAMHRKVEKWKADAPDVPRYKALGNSMATNVMLWIGERMQTVNDILNQ